MPLRRPLPRTLPCHPCPHRSACCAFGVRLFEDEAAMVRHRFGPKAIVWDGEDEAWRTAIVAGMCRFWDHGCTIHEEPFYPRICKGFPWRFGDTDEPYPYDVTICPELAGEGLAGEEPAGEEPAGAEEPALAPPLTAPSASRQPAGGGRCRARRGG